MNEMTSTQVRDVRARLKAALAIVGEEHNDNDIPNARRIESALWRVVDAAGALSEYASGSPGTRSRPTGMGYFIDRK